VSQGEVDQDVADEVAADACRQCGKVRIVQNFLIQQF